MDLNIIGSAGAWIVAHGGETVVGIMGLVTFASMIANFTKTDADNKAIAAVSKAINWFALNFVKKP